MSSAKLREAVPCACGCGRPVLSERWRNARWVKGHSSRRPEHRVLAAKIGKEHLGREWVATKRAIVSPTTHDLVWAAGFLEGEGYFGKGSGYVVTANQVNSEPAERLLRLFGGSLKQRLYERPRSSLWVWSVCGARARGVMMTLYLLLSGKRKGQIRGALGVAV